MTSKKLLIILGLVTMTAIQGATNLSALNHTKSPGGRATTAFDRPNQLTVGGYFDTEWVSSSSADTFKAHRLILEGSTQIKDKIFFNFELEMEYGAAINAYKNDGEIKLEQAWVDYKFNDAAILRTGIIVVPFGSINVLHDSDFRDTTNKPLYNVYIIPGTWSDVGIGLHGIVDSDQDWLLNYEIHTINGLQQDGTSTSISGTTGLKGARGGFKADNNKNKAVVGRVGFSPYIGLEIGGSAYAGNYDNEDNNNLSIIGVDGIWQNGPIEIQGEVAQVTLDGTGSIPTKMSGYFVEGRYHFLPDFLKNSFLTEGLDHPTFTAFGRIGGIDLDNSVTDANDITQLTIGINFRPVETTVFKMELEILSDSLTKSSTRSLIGSVAVGF